VTERLGTMTTAPVKTIQTAYTGTQFRVSQDGKPIANNPSYAIPGAVPFGYAPPVAVRAAPSGVQAQSVAIPAMPGYQEFMLQEMLRQQQIGGGARARGTPVPALVPQGAQGPQGSRGAPTPKLGMARCGSSTIVCQAGAETAMCNGQPVPCR
jgi:hypothetical protein